MSKEEYRLHCVKQFERLFESEYKAFGTPRPARPIRHLHVEPLQGTGGYVIPPPNFFIELKKVLNKYGILLVVDEIQMGFFRTGKLWSIEHFTSGPTSWCLERLRRMGSIPCRACGPGKQ